MIRHLRKRLLLKITFQSLIILLISIQFVLTVLTSYAHLKLQLNKPVKDKDIETEHICKEQSMVTMHHGMGINDTIMQTVVSCVIGVVNPVKKGIGEKIVRDFLIEGCQRVMREV